MTAKEKKDAYGIVTERILAKLDEGVVPWAKPWDSATGAPMSLSTGKPYRGINVLLLGMQFRASRWWGTYKQISERGGQVRKGEKGTPVVLWKPIEKKDKSGNVTDKFLILRYYTVFSLDQCDGIADPDEGTEPREAVEPIAACEEIWQGYTMRPEVKHGGGRAYYSPLLDYIGMPERDSFHSGEGYYATLFHEGVHSTGHENRLARKDAFGGGFGSGSYGHEELTAEFGAAMLCAIAGIEPNIDQHAAYIAAWRKAIADDPKLVVQAAARAQKAADYILGVEADAARASDSPEAQDAAVPVAA